MAYALPGGGSVCVSAQTASHHGSCGHGGDSDDLRSPRQQPGRKKKQQRTDASPQPNGREGAWEGACSVPFRNAPQLQYNSATQPASAEVSSEQTRISSVGVTMSSVNVSESHVNISE